MATKQIVKQPATAQPNMQPDPATVQPNIQPGLTDSLAQQTVQPNMQPSPAGSPTQQAAYAQLFNFNFYSQWWPGQF